MPKNTTQPEPTNDQPSLIGPNTTWDMTIAWSEVKPAYDKVLSRLAKKVKSAGFRPGKVPAHIAATMISPEELAERTLQEIMPAKYQAALEENKKQPISRPSIVIKKADLNQDWEVEIAIAERPTVDLKGYEKVVKEAKKTAQKAWAEHLAEHNQPESADKAADKNVEHHHEHTEAEEKDFTLQEVYKQLITTYKIVVPELLLKEHTQEELEYMVRQLQSMKMGLDDYLKHRQMTFEQLSTELAMQVLGKLQLEFILEGLRDTTKLEATDADLDKYFERISDEKDREAQKTNPDYRHYVSSLVIREKLTDHLLSL